MNWYKGQLHNHSTNSDGNTSPFGVLKYYKNIGMNFSVISDHNYLTLPDKSDILIKMLLDDENFIHIPAYEYTGTKLAHVLGINVKEAELPPDQEKQAKMSVVEILQDGINKINANNGVPIVCHPLWRWAFDDKEISQLNNVKLFEVCNASPDCNSYPIFGESYIDKLWDNLLSKGYKFYGTASDDAHTYYFNPGEYNRNLVHAPIGGRGWVTVKAEKLDIDNILDAIENGHFYATTGIELEKYIITENSILIQPIDYNNWKQKFQINFIGYDGKVLKSEVIEGSQSVEYKIDGNEKYVRIRMESSSNTYLWTQPVFLDNIEKDIDWTNK